MQVFLKLFNLKYLYNYLKSTSNADYNKHNK